jgi:hypothetical protein
LYWTTSGAKQTVVFNAGASTTVEGCETTIPVRPAVATAATNASPTCAPVEAPATDDVMVLSTVVCAATAVVAADVPEAADPAAF